MKKILLISGHGAGDPGAPAKHDGVLYQEAVEAEALVKKIALALGGYDVAVEVYPCDQDAYKDYMAGTLRLPAADLLVEVHFNAFKYDSGDGIRKGTEVLVAPNALPTAKEAAAKIAEKVSGVLGVPNRGVKTQSLAVCWTAGQKGIPAVLVEVCFIDDADDWTRYYLHREQTADAICAAACAYLGAGTKKADVTADCSMWAKDDCEWAAEKGLFRGNENGDFRWTQPVTREELAAVLRRMAG